MADSTPSSGTIVSGVAGRYATALFELARDENAVDEVLAALVRVEALAAESPDLARLIKSPVFTAEEQQRAIAAVLERAGIGGLAANFVKLVASKRRLFLLPAMVRAFRALVAQAKGVVSAEIRLAEQPSDQVMEEIKATLREVAKAEIDLDVRIDPSLIGGLVVKVGSRMIDASLRTKLNSIRLAMKEVR